MSRTSTAATLVLALFTLTTGSAPSGAALATGLAPSQHVPTRDVLWVGGEHPLTKIGINTLGDVAVSSGGKVMFSWTQWTDEQFTEGDIWGALASANKAGNYKVKKSQKLASNASGPELEWLEKNTETLVATWPSEGSIQTQRLKNNGKPRGKPVTVAKPPTNTTFFGPAFTKFGTGGVVAYASFGADYSVHLQDVNAKAKPTGKPRQIHEADDAAFPASVSTLDDCRLVVVREFEGSEEKTWLKLVDKTGNVLDEVAFEDRVNIEPPSGFGIQFLAAQRRSDGSFNLWEHSIVEASGKKVISASQWAVSVSHDYLLLHILLGSPPDSSRAARRSERAIGIALNSTRKRLEIVYADQATQTVRVEPLLQRDSIAWAQAAWIDPPQGDANAVIFWEQANSDTDWSIHARFARIE